MDALQRGLLPLAGDCRPAADQEGHDVGSRTRHDMVAAEWARASASNRVNSLGRIAVLIGHQTACILASCSPSSQAPISLARMGLENR